MTARKQESTGSADMAKRGAEAHDWSWVEASVWTDRMVSALGNGVKGGRILRNGRVVRPVRRLAGRETLPMRKPPTGEPYAGKPHVRFGGRGGREPFPTPIGKGANFGVGTLTVDDTKGLRHAF